MEAALLGCILVSASFFAAVLEHPSSPVRQGIEDPLRRRALMGLAMAGTNVALIFSPWGKQSGAHMNPSVTLTYLRLGKIAPADAAFYVLFQFAGGIAGTALASLAASAWLSGPPIHHVATTPGRFGPAAAFAGELGISAILMLAVLTASNTRRLAPWTGVFAASLVFLFISFEAPLSGMSLNPARTFGPALAERLWDALWIYFTAPPLGMLLGAEAYRLLRRSHPVLCAKLHHHNDKRCIFRCGYAMPAPARETPSTAPASQQGVSLDINQLS